MESLLFLSLLVYFTIAPPQSAIGADTTSLSALYWCAHRSGNELRLKPGPGCEPLVEKEEKERKSSKATRSFDKTGNLERDVEMFLQQYRRLLACCAQEVESIEDAVALEEQASALIQEATTRLSPAAFLASRNQALVVPVLRARDKLRTLVTRLQHLDASKTKADSLDYEDAARKRRMLQEAEDAIAEDFHPTSEPGRAATGTDIGRAAPTGPDIGAPGPTGTRIGTMEPTGTDIGSTPPTLGEVVGTPPSKRGGGSLTTTDPVTEGAVGAEIGTTPSTGPAIGNSSLNSRHP
ncbi:MAG TPA: hypothetical protein VJ692_04850 [Nitrospiraceae bacterium]|nr:hypothetical protein [Nitrospiraceae bacterium]